LFFHERGGGNGNGGGGGGGGGVGHPGAGGGPEGGGGGGGAVLLTGPRKFPGDSASLTPPGAGGCVGWSWGGAPFGGVGPRPGAQRTFLTF